MIEFGVENYKNSSEFPTEHKAALGNRPSFIFIGEEFEHKEEFKKLANILVDFFRGNIEEAINLAGLEHVIVCSSTSDKVYFRTYRVYLKKSGTKLPRVELMEMGPSMDFTIRRHTFASNDLLKIATKIPKEDKPKKEKNIKTDTFDTKGTIHMPRQDLSEMATRKMKGFKKRMAPEEVNEGFEQNKKKKDQN